MMDNGLKFLDIGTGAAGRRIAVRQQAGAAPGLFWLSGYKSDMKGTKAEALAHWATATGRACTRFDYSGHGESSGAFTRRHDRPLARGQPCGVRRVQPRAADFDRLVDGRLARAVAGASAAAARRGTAASVAGMVLIAPAVDFTEELMWRRFTPAIKHELEENGVWERPSEYSHGALSDHPGVDRGRAQSPSARRHDRDRLPGAHPARRRRIRTCRGSTPSSWCRGWPATTWC